MTVGVATALTAMLGANIPSATLLPNLPASPRMLLAAKAPAYPRSAKAADSNSNYFVVLNSVFGRKTYGLSDAVLKAAVMADNAR